MLAGSNMTVDEVVAGCQTSYSGRTRLDSTFIVVLVSLDIIVMVLNFVFNVLVILSLVLSKQLYNTSLKLVMYLSISDCCIACVVQPLFAVLVLLYPTEPNCVFEMVVQFFAIFFTHTSGYIIALIGYDRFARIKYMTKYSGIMTERRLKWLIAVAMLLSVLQALAYVVGTQFSFFNKAKRVAVIIDFLIALLVLLSYAMAVWVARKYRKNSTNKDMLKKVDRTITKLASKILLSIVAFYIVYVAISMTHSSLVNKVNPSTREWLEFLLLFGYLLTYTNSLVNAAIFLGVNKKARKALKRRFQTAHQTYSLSTEDTIAMSESNAV